MALINCPECERQISNQAAHCIHCGYPLRELYSTTRSATTTVAKPENDEPIPARKTEPRSGVLVEYSIATGLGRLKDEKTGEYRRFKKKYVVGDPSLRGKIGFQVNYLVNDDGSVSIDPPGRSQPVDVQATQEIDKQTGSENKSRSSANQLKYIGVWAIWSLVSYFGVMGVFNFIEETGQPLEPLAFLPLEFGIKAGCFILIYSFFSELNVRRVMPYLYVLVPLSFFGIDPDDFGQLRSLLGDTPFFFSLVISLGLFFYLIRAYFKKRPGRWY